MNGDRATRGMSVVPLAGIVAGLLGYAVVKLGVRFPSSGGIIAYLSKASGTAALWASLHGSATSRRSRSSARWCRCRSGAYATSLSIGDNAGPAWDNVFTSAAIIATLAINVVGSKIVDPRSWTLPHSLLPPSARAIGERVRVRTATTVLPSILAAR